jgi:hypothetical protein
LQSPSSLTAENSQSQYGTTFTLDGATFTLANTGSGNISQHLFSFDLISYVERKHGVSIGVDLAAKVAWVKANATSLTFKWHGFGSSPIGSKATVSMWDGVSAWITQGNHTSASVAMLSYTFNSVNINSRLDSNGFVHLIAYADASNGTVASTINTDYVELNVEYRATFVNGNTFKYPANSATLLAPSGSWTEESISSYSNVSTLNGVSVTSTKAGSTHIAQQLFTFDLISIIEKQYNTSIPGATIAQKVTWLRSNITSLVCNYYGYGSSPTGNKASFSLWNNSTLLWDAPRTVNHSNNTFNKLSITVNSFYNLFIDNNGFMYFIAYADQSDGTTVSTINTDYIELLISASVLDVSFDVQNPRTLTRERSQSLVDIGVADFVGKVNNSLIENPNKIYSRSAFTILSPSASVTGEFQTADYSLVSTLDDSLKSSNVVTNSYYRQHFFSFNLIDYIYRKYGAVVDVLWLRSNITNITCNWYGYGSSPTGNKSSLSVWDKTSSSWLATLSHTNPTVTKITRSLSDMRRYIQDDGYAYFVAYADPSDGITASTIITDCVSLSITINTLTVFPKI